MLFWEDVTGLMAFIDIFYIRSRSGRGAARSSSPLLTLIIPSHEARALGSRRGLTIRRAASRLRLSGSPGGGPSSLRAPAARTTLFTARLEMRSELL